MTNLTGTRKAPLGHNKRSSVHDDIPIRLAVTFAPSRARVLQGESDLLHSVTSTCQYYWIGCFIVV